MTDEHGLMPVYLGVITGLLVLIAIILSNILNELKKGKP